MTTKHEIEIPDLPDGYRLVRVNIKQNDRYRNDDGTSTIAGCDLIVEKIKPYTFTLNGVELPMPKKEFGRNKVHLHMVDYRPPKVDEEIFFFETIDEAVAFYDGLREALTRAMK